MRPAASLRGAQPLDQFLAGQLSERTRRAYQADLLQFFGTQQVTPELVRSITFHDVVEFRNYLAAQGMQRTTINRKLSSLRAFYRMLVAAGVVEQNPADAALVRGFRIDESMIGKAIPSPVMRRMLEAIRAGDDEIVQARDLALFYLLTYAGLRRSEAARMQWCELRQEAGFHVLLLPETKSGVPQSVKLQPAVVEYLAAYREALQRHGFDADGPVFISLSTNQSHGQQLTPQSVNLIVKRYARKAGVPAQAVTAHRLRHTCCTLAIEGGARPQQVQSHLRHKDLKTTMRYYEDRERLADNASDYIDLE